MMNEAITWKESCHAHNGHRHARRERRDAQLGLRPRRDREPDLFGWGEATLEWKTRGVVGAIEDLAPLLLGRDPRDIEQAVRVMKKHSFWRLGVIGMSAVSGIEMALWDILGKALGVPVWRLLGGKVRDKVRVYTHLGIGDMRAVYETNDAGPLVSARWRSSRRAIALSRRSSSPTRTTRATPGRRQVGS